MNLPKKILSLLTVFCLTLALVPTAALAADSTTYSVWVGNTQVTSENKDNVLASDGEIPTVTYDPDTKTLTLTDADITGAQNRALSGGAKDACGIYAMDDLTIELVGSSRITGAPETQENGNYGIFVSGNLTFTSDSSGSVNISGGSSSGRHAWVPGVYAKNITVKRCNVTANGGTVTRGLAVNYAMSSAPALVGALVKWTSLRTDGSDRNVYYSKTNIQDYRWLQIEQIEEDEDDYNVAMTWASETGVTNDITVSPDQSCTRGQIVTFLYRMAGSPAVTGSSFQDVAASAEYSDAVRWAVEQGVTKGTSQTTFSPNQTCTRAQAAAFLYRVAGSPTVTGSSFQDVADSAYYSTAVAWAVEQGITKGTSETTFSPDQTCSCGQILAFLYRIAQGI